MEDVLEVYERPYNPQEPVVCLDEKPVTLHADVRPASPAKPGREARQDNEYKRRGTANIFCAVEPKAGRHFTFATPDRSGFEFAKVAFELALQYPAASVHLILDNLNIHRCKSLTDLLGNEIGTEVWNRFTVHYTPTHRLAQSRWKSKSEITRASAWAAAGFPTSALCNVKPAHGTVAPTTPGSKSTGNSTAEPPAANSTTKGNLPRGQRPSLYHGGALSDEVAALAALAIGARVEAGPTTRQFSTGDSRGRPIAYAGHQPPILPRGDGRVRLPGMQGSRFLGDLQWLGDWVDRDPRDEIALIRSARLYQEALWICDAEPELAWLLLVSAVETVADRWHSVKVSKVDRLRDAKPRVVQLLEENCPSILAGIADELADSVGSTRKFVEFALHFLPPAPTIRPPEGFQIEWEPVAFAKMLRTIYNYRSKALHTGVPFPAPMCEAPINVSPALGICERPLGLATSTMSAVWLQKDTPMLLHIFAYVTREALKAWWSALKPRSDHENLRHGYRQK